MVFIDNETCKITNFKWSNIRIQTRPNWMFKKEIDKPTVGGRCWCLTENTNRAQKTELTESRQSVLAI